MKSLCLISLLLFAVAPRAAALQLVSDDTINTQKNLTTNYKLKNGIPVVIRNVEGSDIIAVNVTWATGLRDLPVGKRALNDWLWPSMTMASTTVPKAKKFETEEKFGLEIACAGGIESSSCGLGTVDDYWHQGLDLFAALITTPALTDEDLKLTKDRLTAQLKNTPSNPEALVNEILNKIFYPAGHPYRLNHDEALAELEKVGKHDVVDLHKQILNASIMQIVVATSMPAEKVLADLDKAFGTIPTAIFTPVVATVPHFDEKNAYSFHDRDLPTAFIRIKLNGPSVTDKDAMAAKLLFEILSEELGDEVRTKRSLSYAVHSYILQYSLGVGVISASTSKPKETLEAIQQVIETLKAKTYTDDELEIFKRSFATSYYLTLETHSSLAGALSTSKLFYGTAEELYDMPRKLDKVTPADIKRLANELLVEPRIGVIYGRKDFDDSWALDLIKKNAKNAQKSH